MLRRITRVAPQNAVAPGNTTIFTLPVDRRYHKAQLKVNNNANRNTIESIIERVRVIVDDVEQRNNKASEILDINAIYGVDFVAGYLDLFFSEPWLRNLSNENLLSWSMGNVANFRIEVDVAASASNPQLELTVEHDNPINEDGTLPPLDNIVKWFRRPIGVTSTGERDIMDLPKDQGRLKALHLFQASAGDIETATLDVDQLQIFNPRGVNDLKRFIEVQNPDYNFGGPDGDVISLITALNGNMQDTLPLVKNNGQRVSELKLTTTMATASDFTVVGEYIGKPA